MRRQQIRQLECGIRLLKDAHREIKKHLEKCRTDAARDLLEQCQQYAVKLGEMIEKEEGEGLETVGYLEDYCELLYKLYQETGRERQSTKAGRSCKSLNEMLHRIESSVRREIRVYREVVFLPYKASMWDSMESVWRAAHEDPDCEAYVIPIPYFDRKPDGKLGEMHYEGELYPEDVPVTDYQEYDFAGRHPDMIVIHNPYDSCNFVTSVHPFFYAGNLKQFTDRLVYIPYFVLDEPDPEDPDAVKRMEHFCMCPGVIHADRVVVQSEKMRRIYIDVLTRSTIGSGFGKSDWEKKIFGLGSPKIDKILHTNGTDLKLPESWRKIIEKPGGEWKKILFYNTGIHALMEHNEKILEKIEAVLSFMKNRQDEIAFIWRPHPLIGAAMESLRPQLLDAYQEIVQRYREEEWGIYDDTPKLHRAVQICDAYYGDTSSVVQLCEKAGKAVLIQEPGIKAAEPEEEAAGKALHFEDFYDDGDHFWFAEYDFNGLFRMDKKTGQVKLAGLFPEEEFLRERLYVSVAACCGKLYFAPYSADGIAEYDLVNGDLKKIPVIMPRRDGRFSWTYEKFFHAVALEEKIYFIPWHYPGILCYDPKTGESICYDDWVDEIEELRVSEWGYFSQSENDGSRLILPCVCAGAVVIFDVKERRSRVIHTPDVSGSCKYCGICRREEICYLVSADGTVWKRKLDHENEAVSSICLPGSCEDEITFYPVLSVGVYVYLFPYRQGRGYKLDTRTDQVTPMGQFDEEWEVSGEPYSFLAAGADKEYLYIMTGGNHLFIKYDPLNEKKYMTRLYPSMEDHILLTSHKKEAYRRKFREETIDETETEVLGIMLDLLQEGSLEREKSDPGNGETGQRIYQELIK